METSHIGLVGDTYTILLSSVDTDDRYCLIDMQIRRLRKERATWPAIAAELGQRGVTLDPWTIRRFFKRAQSGKVPLGFAEPQYPLPG